MTYNLSDYGAMIADKARMDPYAYALKSAITPNSVVLDIGAATGIHTLLACKFGAKKVYAVEPNNAIALAQKVAEENGFTHQIEFIQDLSTSITLPERADIIVSDLRGVLPLFAEHIPAIIDARNRHMASDGILIPKRDKLWVALVEGRQVYQDLIAPWDSPYGLKMQAAKLETLSNWSYDNTDLFKPKDLLTDPKLWAELDYATVKTPHSNSKLTLKANQNGVAHGWLMWFDAELTSQIGFSNAPGIQRPPEVYGRAFFPLIEPVNITVNDEINLSIAANLADGHYTWHWKTHIYNSARTTLKADFNQTAVDTDTV